jgi:hypothetical protein
MHHPGLVVLLLSRLAARPALSPEVSASGSQRLMHPPAGLLRFFAYAILGLILVESTLAAAQTECEVKRRSCITECRARSFSIDPRRNACIANCTAEAAKCAREQPERQVQATTPAAMRIRLAEGELRPSRGGGGHANLRRDRPEKSGECSPSDRTGGAGG